jgi:hypothetical protein
MTAHVIKWYSAAPMWTTGDLSGLDAGFARPALLRFATDSFMEEFLTALERDPARIRTLAVLHETWRTPMQQAPAASLAEQTERAPARPLALSRLRLRLDRLAGLQKLPTAALAPAGPYRLKLYQPVHQRYYLVAATLACELAGLPDRAVDPGNQERVGFVVRRLYPRAGIADGADDKLPPYDPVLEQDPSPAMRRWEEYAYLAEPAAARWQRLTDPTALLPDEERLSLFPSTYTEFGQKRRIFAGLVPAGRREVYMAASRNRSAATPATPQGEDPRLLLLQGTVLEPWKALIGRAETFGQADAKDPNISGSGPQPSDPAVRLNAGRGDVQLNSWLLLVDWVDWLATNLPDALADIRGKIFTRAGAVGDLVRALQAVVIDPALITELAPGASGPNPASAYHDAMPDTLVAAIAAMAQYLATTGNRETLEAHTEGFPFPAPRATTRDPQWPPLLFLFADARNSRHALPPLSLGTERGFTTVERMQSRVDFLFAPACRALGLEAHPDLPASTAVVATAPDMREGWFVIRCVYERPECAPLESMIVSAPTDAFQIAGFFDPDAPARPIRIGLPIDTTPAGLRKFDRKTMFMVSDILCGQIDRMKGLSLGDLVRSVLPWPLHKDISVPERAPCEAGGGISLGLMCSLSIPIVTICALILLMIMVNLLDFIFRWVPYFVMCLPVPGFKGKR